MIVLVRGPLQQWNIDCPPTEHLGKFIGRLSELANMPAASLRLSYDPSGQRPIAGDATTLLQLGVSHGSRLFLQVPGKQESKSLEDASKPVSRPVTPRCTHGPNGRCSHCVPATTESSDVTSRCAHGPGMHCPYCPSVKSSGEEIEWLCTHGPDQVCSNCVGVAKGEKVELEMLCLHGEHGVCTNCMPAASLNGRKHMSYEEFLNEERKLCSHAKSKKNFCIHCTPPSEVSYLVKPNCPNHNPWPRGLCSDCRPPVCTLRRQPYRYVDYIEFRNIAAINRFISLYNEQNGQLRLGSLEPDPTFPQGVRAVVQEIYEPSQEIGIVYDSATDIAEETICDVTGMVPLGMVFAHEPREDLVTGEELVQMSQRQIRHATAFHRNTYVTVIIAKDPASMEVIPQAFMVSDQGLALVKENIIRGDDSSSFCIVREPAAKEFITPVIRGDDKLGTQEVKRFESEFLLVDVACGSPAAVRPGQILFAHSDFPIENRELFSSINPRAQFASLLRQRQREPFWMQLSDFHMLLYCLMEDKDLANLVLEVFATRMDQCPEEAESILRPFLQ